MKATPTDRLSHMADAIAQIELLVASTTLAQLRMSPVLRAAFERFLEIVSEASRHIPDDWKQSEPMIPWQDIASLGNIIRHAYDGVDVERLWMLNEIEVPALSAAVARMQQRPLPR